VQLLQQFAPVFTAPTFQTFLAVVTGERTTAWLHAFGRLRRRLERLTEIQAAFLRLVCALICLRFLN
jgi:hypothetical protein